LQSDGADTGGNVSSAPGSAWALAGTIGDLVDRRRFLLVTQAVMLLAGRRRSRWAR
jgi:hypothetical protein